MGGLFEQARSQNETCPVGGRNVEQAMAGAHVAGSPFRVLVVQGAAAANASFAYGAGIVSSLAGDAFGTSAFTIRRANQGLTESRTNVVLQKIVFLFSFSISISTAEKNMSCFCPIILCVFLRLPSRPRGALSLKGSMVNSQTTKASNK